MSDVNSSVFVPPSSIEAVFAGGVRFTYVKDVVCSYDFIPNMTMGEISLNCCGLKCSVCGREQMNLQAPNYCPDCGARVIATDGDINEQG